MTLSGKDVGKEVVLKEAMHLFRKARAKIESDHPALLSQMETIVGKMQKEAEIREETRRCAPEYVDSEKNMETVMKLLALKPQGHFMHRSVKALLRKKQH